jgi:prepilin-type N-terminal cleavage/methylation domain-containing protein
MKFKVVTSPPRTHRRGGFTLAELMASLIIVSLIATAATYLLAATCQTQQYVQNDATTDSQVDFARQRITENIRAATAVAITSSSITITSPPSPLISGGTFTITYSLLGSSLTEIYVNNTNSTTYTSSIIVTNVGQFSVAALVANPKAFQVTLSVGSVAPIQRTFVAFGRNL